MKRFETFSIKCSFILAVFAIFFIFSENLPAQNMDTKGTDFILTFMPNYHTGDDDSVYIFVSIEEATNMTITFSHPGQSDLVITKNLTNTNTMYEFAFPYSGYELGNGFSGSDVNYEETPTKLSARITSDKEINVYGLSTATRSSDAFLVLPTDVLNNEYYVLAYYSDYNDDAFTPSQFAVAAVEDNTQIQITPTVNTENGHTAGTAFTVNLNKGECYLVSSSEAAGSGKDLSGTYITGSKPFALFAGQQRTALPHEASSSGSHEFICSQIPPIASWGKNAFVIPFPQPSNISTAYKDRYRVLSASDNNIIDVNGTKRTLNKGEWFEDDIATTALNISSTEPMLVAQYKRSSMSGSSGTSTSISDPLFLVIPPKEQFIESAILMNMDRLTDYESTFPYQYIFVVAPDSMLTTCKIDNKSLSASAFTSIKNSGYSYTVYTSSVGIHTFASDAKCGLYVVGYGHTISYGYVGGMMVKNINDTIPAKITAEKSCYTETCTVSDEMGESEGLKSITVIQNETDNVQVNIPTNISGIEKITFTASLIDRSRDGYFAVEVIDMHNNTSTYRDTLSGNSMTLVYNDGIDNAFDSTTIGTRKCGSFKIKNNGTQTQTLDGNVFFRIGKYFSLPASQFPITLAPGEAKEIIFCTLPTVYDKLNPVCYDTLDIDLGCNSGVLPVSVIPQKISGEGTAKCGVPVSISVTSVADALIFESPTITAQSHVISFVFGVPSDGLTTIDLFDASGNIIAEIFNKTLKSGFYNFDYNYSNLSS